MALIASAAAGQAHAPPAPRLTSGTPQQEAFWAALRDGDGHLMLEARAGTGKSTSIAEGMHRMPRSARMTYCAFNKHIAAEFAARAPGHVHAATMHSLGFRMIRDALGDVAIESWKSETLAERYFPAKWEDRPARNAVSHLVSLCKNLLDDGTDRETLLSLVAVYDVNLGQRKEDILAVVGEVLRESAEHTSIIDFDDMIWLPIRLGLDCARPSDLLFVDECQDTNRCQMALMSSLCPDGRQVGVGDDRQAIYGFRGADSAAMESIAARLDSADRGLARLPLTITWRCPRSHVRLANAIVPDLEAAPGAIEGQIVEADEPDALAALAPGDMVLCRHNAPLVGACYRLLRQGRKAVVRGRDIGKGLLALIARLKAQDVPTLIGRLDDYRVRETQALNELRNPGPALVALSDRVSCLLAMCEGSRTTDEVKARIEALFSDLDERGAVVFSSIHRAKGLERDRITILRPDLLASPFGQEGNLAYVAATRSRRLLTFAGPIPAAFESDDRPHLPGL